MKTYITAFNKVIATVARAVAGFVMGTWRQGSKSTDSNLPDVSTYQHDAEKIFHDDTPKSPCPVACTELQNNNWKNTEGEDIGGIQSNKWDARSDILRNLKKLAPAPIPPEIDNLLRDYQRLGVAWLWHLHQNNLGGILADEMGLGKTIQALAFLAVVRSQTPEIAAFDTSAPVPSLVVCPASLLENWRREATRFAPDLRVFVHHGANRLSDATTSAAYDLIITSYGTLVRDNILFSKSEFGTLVADEAQNCKNYYTKNARTLRTLHARSRFLLTGTPLENSLDDIRSLFAIIMPGYLAPISSYRYDNRYAVHDDENLRNKTAPYILRRTKKAVAPELPEKIEQIVYCEFGPPQAALYREVKNSTKRNIRNLEACGAPEDKIRKAILTQLLRLRQICCHPRLLENSEFWPLAPDVYSKSAKLGAFFDLLTETLDAGHRVLVFSQFTTFLSIVRAELDAQQIHYAYLDGGTSARERQVEIDRFNNPHFDGSPAIPIFLISLKAGGTGLNLTAADTVILLDPWWNPAVEAQAIDRAHRIGQTRVVTSYKIICSGTIEERLLHMQARKGAIAADIFDATSKISSKLSLDDLKSLLD